MSTVGVTVSFTQVDKNEVYKVAGNAILAAGVKDLEQANQLVGTVCGIACAVPGGSHVNGSVYLTVSTSGISGSISLSAGTPLPQPVQPKPIKCDAAPGSSEPAATGG
jgi:hypothetical protein